MSIVGGNYSQVASGLKELKYMAAGLTTGSRYLFVVTARNSVGPGT